MPHAPCPMPTWLDRVLVSSQLIWLWPGWPDLSLLLEFQTHGPFKYFPSPREYMPATNSASPSRNIAHARLACAYASWTVLTLYHQQITRYPSPPPSPPQDQDWLASWRSSASASATATAEAPYPRPPSAPQLSSDSTTRRGSSCPSQRRNQSHLHRNFFSSLARTLLADFPQGPL